MIETMKSYTNLEQSKMLAKILSPESADMYYPNRTDIQYQGALPIGMKHGNRLLSQEIPCWSLAALLELIPEKIPGTKLVIKWDGSYYIEGRDCLFDNAIDAAFEMVCWLKENNKI